jgi:hypothetical protein
MTNIHKQKNNEYFNFFDKIFCICGNKEVERWNHCKMQFEDIGILNRVERLSDFPPANKTWKEFNMPPCEYSHYSILKSAVDDNLKNILIFESDFHFINKDFNLLNKSIQKLKTLDWKLFYLGGNPRTTYGVVDDNLIKSSASSTHAYAVNGKCFEEVIKNLESFGNKFAIDQIYRRQRKFNFANFAYMTYPLFFVQKDKNIEYWRTRNVLKKWKNRIQPMVDKYKESINE